MGPEVAGVGFGAVILFEAGILGFWRCLRPALSIHTARALATMPVSISIANATSCSFLSESEFSELKNKQNSENFKIL